MGLDFLQLITPVWAKRGECLLGKEKTGERDIGDGGPERDVP